MKEVLLIKLGEMVLKGQNRRVFDQALLKNIKHALKGAGAFDVQYAQSTVYVIPEDGADMDLAEERISKVFGVISYVRACTAERRWSPYAGQLRNTCTTNWNGKNV